MPISVYLCHVSDSSRFHSADQQCWVQIAIRDHYRYASSYRDTKLSWKEMKTSVTDWKKTSILPQGPFPVTIQLFCDPISSLGWLRIRQVCFLRELSPDPREELFHSGLTSFHTENARGSSQDKSEIITWPPLYIIHLKWTREGQTRKNTVLRPLDCDFLFILQNDAEEA
jgi:hypothetical protein